MIQTEAARAATAPELQLPDGNIGIKTVSKNKLSDFAKDVIRDCATQPKNSVNKTYKQVMMFCPKSGYTAEQVGKYLRRVRRAIQRKNAYLSETPYELSLNVPHVTDWLPLPPCELSPKKLEKVSFNRSL